MRVCAVPVASRDSLDLVRQHASEVVCLHAPDDFRAIGQVEDEALAALEQMRPDVRIVSLDTAVTTSEDAQSGKGIHYRMNPANLPCLTSAAIDCCVLANNHVLDWGRDGLVETLACLRGVGLRTAGAG